MVKNLPASAGDIRDVGSVPGLGRSPGGEYGNTLHYSCLESPTDRGAWWATVHGVAQLEMTSTHVQSIVRAWNEKLEDQITELLFQN